MLSTMEKGTVLVMVEAEASVERSVKEAASAIKAEVSR